MSLYVLPLTLYVITLFRHFFPFRFPLQCPPPILFQLSSQYYLQSRTKPLETIHKTRIFNLNVGKQRVKTFSHTPPPPYNVALGWNFLFNIEWGRGGLEFYTNHQFARSNPVFNNCLNTFVQDCS